MAMILMDDLRVETLDAGINTLLELWHEDGDGDTVGTVCRLGDDDGRPLATLTTIQVRGIYDAIVLVEVPGRKDRCFRCHYVFQDGKFVESAVEQLPGWVADWSVVS